MEKILEVGDVLYNTRPNSGNVPTYKVIIDRVTATQAISGEVRLKRVPSYNDRYPAIGGHYYGFYFGDENSEAQYQAWLVPYLKEKKRKKDASTLQFDTNYSKLSAEKLQIILSIINE